MTVIQPGYRLQLNLGVGEGGEGGVILLRRWFFLNESETIAAVTLVFCSIQ